MRRWNGWGDDSVVYSLPASALRFINQKLGLSQITPDASLEEALKGVPKSRLPRHPLVSTEPLPRLLHARGQSFPDWVELRSGRISLYPDGVAYPTSEEDVTQLLQFAHQRGIHIIPYGGGTSVVGHIDPVKSKAPVLTVDMSRMNRLIDLRPDSLLASFGAGVCGPDLEAQLRARGFTLGHFPQSFEYSTLGGWVATRSSGQQSLRYGRIEKLFAGGRLQTPLGELELPSFPASAAGPDLREMVLGSEGRLGILTQVSVRINPIPEREDFHAVFFPDFQHGVEAVRQILSSGITLCMLRLSTSGETSTTLALAGHVNLIGALERLLGMRGLGEDKCLLLLGFSGKSNLVQAHRKETLDITGKWGGVHVGKTFGEQWHKNRFRTAYLRNTLWEHGYGVDTIETATDWGNTPRMVEQVEGALRDSMQGFGEPVHIFTHLSHVYPQGSSVYTTYIFKLAPDPQETLDRWRGMKSAASQAICAQGGTISHQHGVGTDHLPYLSAEKGRLGMSALAALCRQFDPKGIMNPGKLVV
ncbi:MAG: FAD-linked oxidase [Chloroflexi bacterium RBG_16_54_11]|nr:MAG: FAD-linked oxidase [Chloroflexi bacterium RBG_16_54_11]